MLQLSKLKKARYNNEEYGIEREICKAENSDRTSIEDAGITDGAIILAWDGLYINGIPWDFTSIMTSLLVF